MVCNPLLQEFVLLALLWQLVISEWTRKQSQAPQHPFPQRPTRPSKLPQPFAGLTTKPQCQSCEQGQEASDHPPLPRPPCLRRGETGTSLFTLWAYLLTGPAQLSARGRYTTVA